MSRHHYEIQQRAAGDGGGCDLRVYKDGRQVAVESFPATTALPARTDAQAWTAAMGAADDWFHSLDRLQH